jgi:hypothetical protein
VRYLTSLSTVNSVFTQCYNLLRVSYEEQSCYPLDREQHCPPLCWTAAGRGGLTAVCKKKMQCWLDRQHSVRWRGLAGTLRQARELNSGPRRAAKTARVSFHRAQSRVLTGLVAGHNTLRRQLHITGLVGSPLRSKCGAGDGTSAHVLCECAALATPWHIYLRYFFFDPEGITGLGLGAMWNFFRRTGPS